MPGDAEQTPKPRATTARRATQREPVTIDLAPEPGPESIPLRKPVEDAPPKPPVSSRRVGWLGMLLGAVIGAAIVFAAGYILIETEILPSPGANDGSATLAETTRLQGEIDTLRQQIPVLPQPVDLAPLDRRVAALEAMATEIRALRTDLTALSGMTGTNATRLDDIGRELGALQEQVMTTAAAGGDPAAADRIIDAITAVERRVGALETAGPPAQLLTLQRRVDLLAQQVTTLGANLQVVTAATGERDRTEAAARSIAMSTLSAAAARGEPFAAELAALQGLGVAPAALAALDPFAAADVSTMDELAVAFGPVADAILVAADVGAAPEAGFWERLLDNAAGVVTIRPTAPVAGDSPGAIVSRIEAALAAGDLPTALAERAALPEAALAASSAWADEAQRRVALDAAVDALAAAIRIVEAPAAGITP